ncbi:hypothetical protein K402DRAFT_426145 [Aulographum hederae CBS 113979]|uniref:Uncharacterized protein n=1 Tax=Aulographum hederae CBS 113979 TaxID=1176131 RepID=A0A6G1GIH7_9PEZI|nr:hypothetical protein K402DRAFT_426145 [Aulographum hederae CBS 113979]
MQRFLDQPRCRMIPLSVFLDGQAQSCKNETTSCDQCQELGLLSSSEARNWMEKGEEEEEEQNGNTLLRKYTKQTAEDRERFIWGLELLDGSCVICRLLGDEKQAEHTLDRCRSASKWRFFDAKKAVQKEARRVRKGWLSSFGACFGCGNVQSICGKQAGGGCRFKDVVMPLSWAVLYKADWKEKVLGGLDSGKGSAAAEQGPIQGALGIGRIGYGNTLMLHELIVPMAAKADRTPSTAVDTVLPQQSELLLHTCIHAILSDPLGRKGYQPRLCEDQDWKQART